MRKTARTSSARSKRRKFLSKKLFATVCISLLFVSSSVFLAGYWFYKRSTSPFASADSRDSISQSFLQYPVFSYIVVKDFDSDPINMISVSYVVLDKDSKKAVIYNIPLNIVVDVPGRYGEEEFGKILALGALNSEKPLDDGLVAVNKTLFKIFGFGSGKFILVEEDLKNDFDNLLYKGRRFGFSSLERLVVLKNALKTNLTARDFFEINSFLGSLPGDRFISQDLTFSYTSNPQLLDDIFRDITFISPLAQEEKSISVLNGSGLPGAASFGTRVIRNMGGRVVSIGNCSQNHDYSMIVADNPASETVKYISQVFGIKNIIPLSEAYFLGDKEVSRSDVTLIIGFDLKDLFE